MENKLTPKMCRNYEYAFYGPLEINYFGSVIRTNVTHLFDCANACYWSANNGFGLWGV